MIWAIAVIILLLTLFLIDLKAELTLVIRADRHWQGVTVNMDTWHWRSSRCYDLTNPNLNLAESALLSLYRKHEQAGTASPGPARFNPIMDRAGRFHGFLIRHLIMRRWFKSFHTVNRIEWISTVGGGDACQTALNCGAIWALKGALLALLGTHIRIGTAVVEVRPCFTTSGLASTVKCILRIRLAQIIFMKAYLSGLKSGGE